jgi:hypothetical protein
MNVYYGNKVEQKGSTMAVLDIRGTNGSGKSWIMHQLLDKYSHLCNNVYRSGKSLPVGYSLGYKPHFSLGIIGRYNSVSGGCDAVGGPEEVVSRVKMFDKLHDYVLLEGLLVSHTFKRYSQLASELEDYRFLFLDTPLKVCIRRVRSRRLARGNTKPFNPQNVIKDYNQIWVRTHRNLRDAGHTVKVLDWKDPLPQVLQELRQ